MPPLPTLTFSEFLTRGDEIADDVLAAAYAEGSCGNWVNDPNTYEQHKDDFMDTIYDTFFSGGSGSTGTGRVCVDAIGRCGVADIVWQYFPDAQPSDSHPLDCGGVPPPDLGGEREKDNSTAIALIAGIGIFGAIMLMSK